MTQDNGGAAWRPIASAPDGVLIETKIDDENGCRNEQHLRKRGRLFWTEDGSMYVYYMPTHWRPALLSARKGPTP